MNAVFFDDLPTESREFIELYLNLPLHKWLGLRFTKLDDDCLVLEFKTRPEFIGNQFKGIVSGGVIAAVMDVAGGLAILLDLLVKMDDLPREEKMQRLINSSTIDLRLDYLNPAKGDGFVSYTKMLRGGRRVSFAQTELFSGEQIIAASTGAYLLG